MTAEEEDELRDEVRKMSQQMYLLQAKLFDLKLIKAAHAINRAMGEIGDDAANRITDERKKK